MNIFPIGANLVFAQASLWKITIHLNFYSLGKKWLPDLARRRKIQYWAELRAKKM